MKGPKRILWTLVLLTTAAIAKDPLWIKIGTSGHAKISIDYSNLRYFPGHVVQAWALWDFDEQQSLPNGQPYSSQKQLNRFDCGSDRYALLAVMSYAEVAGNGPVIQSWDNEDAPLSYQHAVPGSVMDGIMASVCSSKFPK